MSKILKTKNEKVKGQNFYHQGAKLKVLKMRSQGKAKRDSKGRIIKAAPFAKSTPDDPVVRVQPDRRWFGNTRVIGQRQLQEFREHLTESKALQDPFMVLLRQNKLPLSLLQDKAGNSLSSNLLAIETFQNTFGKQAQRRKPKIQVASLEELAQQVHNDNMEKELKEINNDNDDDDDTPGFIDPIFQKGQSKRIWNELYKVVDSSDVVIHVLDARNPLGTRCSTVERFIQRNCAHKHVIFVLNKCDLIPTSVTERWVRYLSKERPTVAFRASINNPFGKGALIQLLRQFSRLHMDKPQISVGLIGYPNVGKSSVINALRRQSVCSVAPIPGQTKVWQYVTLMKRIYLIDCPGIVPISSGDSPTDTILKGVVRVECVQQAEEHIPELLKRVDPKLLSRAYDLTLNDVEDATVFLDRLARRTGKLLKGGEPDVSTVAKMVLNDWIRGKIPYFTPPPPTPDNQKDDDLGEDDKTDNDNNNNSNINTTADNNAVSSNESDHHQEK